MFSQNDKMRLFTNTVFLSINLSIGQAINCSYGANCPVNTTFCYEWVQRYYESNTRRQMDAHDHGCWTESLAAPLKYAIQCNQVMAQGYKHKGSKCLNLQLDTKKAFGALCCCDSNRCNQKASSLVSGTAHCAVGKSKYTVVKACPLGQTCHETLLLTEPIQQNYTVSGCFELDKHAHFPSLLGVNQNTVQVGVNSGGDDKKTDDYQVDCQMTRFVIDNRQSYEAFTCVCHHVNQTIGNDKACNQRTHIHTRFHNYVKQKQSCEESILQSVRLFKVNNTDIELYAGRMHEVCTHFAIDIEALILSNQSIIEESIIAKSCVGSLTCELESDLLIDNLCSKVTHLTNFDCFENNGDLNNFTHFYKCCSNLFFNDTDVDFANVIELNSTIFVSFTGHIVPNQLLVIFIFVSVNFLY